MRWLLCGLTFALAMVLAIVTAAIRAGNIQLRHRIEVDYRRLDARRVELRRLSALAIERNTPEHLASLLHLLVQPARPPVEGAPWQ